MLNMSIARTNMIKQQVRTWEVSNDDIVQLFGNIPREHFLPEALHDLAYADCRLPIGHGQVTMPPKELARALEALHIKKTDTVLEIGTGTSYTTALLAELAAFVHSVDVYEDFVDHARSHLQLLGIENISLHIGDVMNGWELKNQQYDAIICTASMPRLIKSFCQQLKKGGRMFAIVGEAPVMTATLITRTGVDEWSQSKLFETSMPALLNAPKPDKFIF